MAEWPNERNERPPFRIETTGGRASDANEAGLRSRQKQSRQTSERTSERLRGGEGRKNTGRRAGREVLTPASDAFSCAKGTKNDQIEDERARRGGRADETGGLVGGRGGVRTGKAQPPRGRASFWRATLEGGSDRKSGV